MDVVAFSQLTLEQQRRVLADLHAAVHGSTEYQAAQVAGQLVSLPTGDGMALVFFGDPLSPVRCAVQVATALGSSGDIRLRMGIHAGPVYRVDDINANLNVTGGGINLAQRVMDAGDAGHIVVSQPVAELLQQTDEWRDAVHDLGVATMKHGVPLHLYNLHRAGIGNAARPRRLRAELRKKRLRWGAAALGTLLAGALGAGYLLTRKPIDSGPADAISSARRSVAVLGFKNLSGRPDQAWLSTALARMMATELAAGGRLRTIPGEVVAQARIDLSLADAVDALTRDALTRLRKRTGADLVVLGSYAEVGTAATAQIRLDVRLQDARIGETVYATAENGAAADLFDVVSRCGQQLRSRLNLGGVSPQQAEQVRASLPSDPRAARLYAEGLSRLHLFDALGARDRLQQAAAAEPRNAQVHSALSAAWSALGYQVKAAEEAKTALDLSAALAREDRLSIEGRYHTASADWPRAIEVYQSLFTFYRDNLEYGLQLSAAQTHGGRGKDALVTVDALRTLPPPASDDPRIDLAEGDAADSIAEQRRALAAYRRAADKARAIGAQLLLAQALMSEGWSQRALGNPAAARASFLEALPIFQQAGDKSNVARVQSYLGVLLSDEGRLGEAAQALARALAVSREIGNSAQTARLLKNLGLTSMREGKPAAAREYFEESLSLSRENGDREAAASTQVSLATWQTDAGDLEAARHLLQQAARDYADIGNRHGEAMATGALANLLKTSGDLTAAREAFERVHAIFADEGNKASQATALESLANVAWMQGRLPEARARLEQGLKLRQELGMAHDILEINAALAQLMVDEGRGADAVPLLREHLAELRTVGYEGPVASVSASLVEALLQQGRVAEARQVVDQVRRHSKGDLALETIVAQARVTAAGGNVNGAVKQLRAALAATDLPLASRFGAELALGQILLAAGRTAEGGAQLTALESSARARGYGFFADRARAARS
jgi:tetratricopeptide (TPR) repeat protein